MREDYRFPNLLVGMLTRESLKEAFKKRITAKQIMGFLQAHAHEQSKEEKQFIGEADSKSIASIFGLTRNKGMESVS